MSSSDRPSKRRRRMYVRWHGDGLEVGRGRVLARDELGVDVAVQLAVEVVVALVLERRAARRALEALHVQVLVLDAHEHAAATNNPRALRSSGQFGVGARVTLTDLVVIFIGYLWNLLRL